ncbi:MAG: PQQ-dependent sugar dehydrogenase [Lautropia sp.]|nr:PQQ-dependent sugar dehydrogenase [Lautropia sp.]
MARGLHHPWALAFLPDGRFLVTERRGTMRIIDRDGTLEAPMGGVPAVHAKGQGGLLDVALPPDFAQTRQVYFCFSEASPSGFNSTALAVGELSANARRLNRVKVLFSQRPKVGSQLHFGCRIVFDGDKLFLTLGERFHEMKQAQKLDNHLGKVVRINRDGSVPADNPFVKTKGALPEIWSYGHRNPQGATLGPDGQLWLHEHGPQGGDEINRVQAGANYGWPVISYGEQYGGGPIGSGKSAMPGMKQPLYYWLPSIAPSGMQFVQHDRYGRDWRGNLLVGALKLMYLARLRLGDDGRVLSEERIPVDERVRDVREAADGHIYILTDGDDGRLLRLKAP